MNPLEKVSSLPFEAPPFDHLSDGHLRPAILHGMALQLAEIQAIIADTNPADFDNTIVALERSGRDLRRASLVFFNLTSSATNDSLQAMRAELVPALTAHQDAISMDPALFARVKAVHDRAAELEPVDRRLVERYYQGYVRSGALLDEAGKERLKALNREIAGLSTTFDDNLMKAVTAAAVLVEDKAQLDGLSEEEIAAAAAAAEEKKLSGKWLIAMRNTTQQPVLASLKDRALRERIMQVSLARNTQGEFDNRKIVTRLARLRAEKAGLLGYPNWAAYVLADQMAGTPEAAVKLLGGMAPAAAANAKAEARKLQAMIDAQGGGFQLQAWDWDFYAEQVRKAEYDLDEAAMKPYLVLDSVLEHGVFGATKALFGITFQQRNDIPVYHPDVRVYDILGQDGKSFGLVYFDFYAREGKSGGAWMSSFVDQNTLLGQAPVITQNCNYLKPAAGQPCLLSFDDVTTLFHEFGHGLHGFLSEQRYPYFSGTATSTDFVEFPSQFFENWAMEPTLLARYARHYATGEPMPAEMVARKQASSRFNQGYATTEYLASALLDLAWHSLPADAPEVSDVEAFERKALAAHGLDLAQVPPRYRTAYFSHIWGGGYAANYYAYMWSEVLEADAYAWFVENGGMTAANGEKFRATVLSQGGSQEGGDMFRALTGRDPRTEPLLHKRGLR